MCYLKGIGTKKNYEEAYKYFERASRQSYLLGDYGVGFCKLNGFGTHQDAVNGFQKIFAVAMHCNNQLKTRKADSEGTSAQEITDVVEELHRMAVSMNDVAFCYEHGLGVTINNEACISWCKKAVDIVRENFLR